MVICPTGGQLNNILRYEDLDTGGTCTKTFDSDSAVLDPVLNVKHDMGVQVPPDIEGDISGIHATADDDLLQIAMDNWVAELTVFLGPDSQWGLGRDPADGVCALVPPDDRGVRDNVEQGDAQLGVSGEGGYEPHRLLPDDRGDHQIGRARAQSRVDAHTHGEADQEHPLRGDDHVQALHDYRGGGVVLDDAAPGKVAVDDAKDEGGDPDEVPPDDQGAAQYELHTRAPADEGGGHGRALHDRVDAGDIEVEGGALHGHGDGNKLHNLAPADEGGGAEEVPPEARDATQYSRVQVPVSGGVHRHGGRADPVHAQRGTGRVHAPLDAGGGVATNNVVLSTVAQDDRGGAHVQAPVDEGGGKLGAVGAHHGVVPASGSEHHGGHSARDGAGAEGLQDEDQDHGLLDDRHGQRVEGGEEEADTAHPHGGAAHVQAPHDEGGGDIGAVYACYNAVPAEEHDDRHGEGGMSRVCQDGDPSQDVKTRGRREAHDDDDLHGPVYDDTGGDVVPHPDDFQAGYLWKMMPRHSVWPGGEEGVTKHAAVRISF